jgi:hypothetical protein
MNPHVLNQLPARLGHPTGRNRRRMGVARLARLIRLIRNLVP